MIGAILLHNQIYQSDSYRSKSKSWDLWTMQSLGGSGSWKMNRFWSGER